MASLAGCRHSQPPCAKDKKTTISIAYKPPDVVRMLAMTPTLFRVRLNVLPAPNDNIRNGLDSRLLLYGGGPALVTLYAVESVRGHLR